MHNQLALPTRIDDRFRPKFHYTPPANWINDPNGLIHWQGRYHMFYQHNPYGSLWGNMHWGHAVSDDLVHWQDLPIALTPDRDSYDEAGVFSGCMVVDDGKPTILYTGTQQFPDGRMPYVQHACVATSADNLLTWHKHPSNPVIKRPAGHDLVGFRDHCVWREGDGWRQIIGSGLYGLGGAAYLYRGNTLTDWDYVGPLLALDQQYFGDVWLGTMWECPQLLFFGDKTILMVSVSHDDQPQQTAYLIGEYRDNRFIPQSAHLLDFGGWHYYAPQAMVDDSGRTLCWGWLRESRSDKLCEAAGWSGVMSIPRVLSLRSDDVLQIEPAPELQQLRRRHWHLTTPDTAISKQVRGTALELSVRIDPGLGRVGVRLLSSETEWTTVFYDRRRGVLGINRSNSTSAQRNEHDLSTLKGHYVLPTNEVLELRIFVDQSVIEVFANGQACVSGRAYPSRTESDGIEILVDEDEFVSADIWTLDTIW